MKGENLQGVYLITDTEHQNRYSHVELADAAYRAGVAMVQYRAKEKSDREALEEINQIVNLAEKKEHQLLIVNDRPDLAIAGGADGVHLGQDDLPIPVARKLMTDDMLIGGTASNVEEVQQVVVEGANYAALGHIFATQTKQKSYAPRGLETLQEARNAISDPLVAIGGITVENASDVIEAGADIIAVSSAICQAADPQKAASEFVALFG